MRDNYYLQISCDHLSLRHLESGRHTELHAQPPFSNQRLLVANFSAATQALKTALAELKSRGWLSLPASLLIQPMERFDGGLSEIEERCLLELGFGTGMRRVKLHIGEQLDDDAARAHLRS